MLMPGDYTGNFEFEKIQGTEDKPIWLAAADGPGTVTITSPSNTESVITIQGEDNIIIRDLTLVGGYDGIEINQSGKDFTDLVHNIVIEGNTILNAANDGIKVGQTSNLVIRNNLINGVAGEQGIDCLGVTNAVIDGNEIMNVGGSSGMFVKGGSSDVLITNNYIHDVSGDGLLVGGWTEPEFFLPGTDYEARNVQVTGNVVENAVKRPLTVLGAQNVDIHDNFFGTLDSNNHVVVIDTGSPQLSPPPPSSDVFIHDNVFDRSNNFAQIDPTSTNVSITDNRYDGVIEGDMRPMQPDPSPVSFADSLPDTLLDAQVWATSARSTNSVGGTSGNDILTGTSGADNLSGGSGDDIMVGGAGDDLYSIGSSRDRAIENPGEGIDTVNAFVKTYTLEANIENLTVKYSSGGTYQGNELNNIIVGGTGNDTLTGGLGNDLFVARANGGSDRITDFAAGLGAGDAIDLTAFSGINGLADVLARSSQVGADTVITFDTGNTLTLSGVGKADLSADDFVFYRAPRPAVSLSNNAVVEGAAPGTVVGSLSAADDTLTYALIDDAGGLFTLSGTDIAVAGNLDYETASTHWLTVQVTDSAGTSYDKRVAVGVTNAAPSAPTDSDAALNSVAEGAAAGTVVRVTAAAVDPSGGPVTYSLVDDADGRFAIDAVTGVVTVKDSVRLDYETSAAHTILVRASDPGGAGTDTSFTIMVDNVGPSDPIDSDGAANLVPERSATGTMVGVVASAADPNGGALRYSLLDDAGGRFAIDASTGVVSVKDGSLLDHNTSTEHAILVQATDAAGATSTSSFIIGVTDVSSSMPAWPTTTRYTRTISGTSGNDNLVGTSGHDYLSGGSGDDVMTGGAGDDTYSISTSRDVIIENPGEGIDTALVYGNKYALSANVENLTVKYTGGGTYQGNELNNIIVSGNGNDILTGNDGDDLFVFAPGRGADTITDFVAGDGSWDTIDLTAFSGLSNLEGVLARSSQVGANTVIDLGSGDSLTLVNVASGNLTENDFLFAAGPPDVNDPPTDIALSNNAIAEGSAPGTVVGSLSTVDPDAGDSFIYTLVDDAGGSFAIDGSNLVVAGALDYETAASRMVTVRVIDSAGNSLNKSLTVNLINEAPPAPVDVDEAANETSENTVNGAAVGIVAAAPDVNGGAVTYSLLNDAGGRFAVDGTTGQVIVANAALIDYETATEHTIVVEARDAGGATSISTFTIGVTNGAPSAPADADETANEVAEGAANGTAVGIAAAAADVNGGAVAYSLIDDAGGRFAIDAATGVVTVADGSLLDYESGTEHTIVVQARDAAGAASTSSFTVGVTNAPPTVPEDSDGASNEVVEGAATGAAVGLVATATDVNGGAVTYSLIDDAGGRFAIDAATGVVTVADGSLIDYETASEHAILVEARDASGAASTASFTIGVANQAPSVPADVDEAANRVKEGAATGTAVGLAAFAADVGGSAVTYSLIDDAGGRFAIDAATGLVTVANGSLIDFETAPEHVIVVQATDAGGAASTASFTIGVDNSAPTAPADADDAPNLVAEGAEDGTAVGIAVVSSEANGGAVAYALLDDAGGRFAIDAVTGVVTVADGSLIDYETASEHTIVVQASDASGVTSTASFTIGVANQAPTVPEDLDEAPDRVAEGSANGTAVGVVVSAADANNGAVTYSLVDDAGGRFAIDATTGLVTVANGALIDYETATEHTIVVQASDAGGATSTASFTIAVGNQAPEALDDADAAANQVVENATNGTAVGIRASASDVNGGIVAYSLLDNAGGRFAIDPTTGLVTVADGSLIDYETATEHTIVVQATDAAGAARTRAFTIAVSDASGVTITGTNNADRIDANSTVSIKPLPTNEADIIYGNGGNDYISALGGDDYINGGSGADTMLGGLGNDTYVVDSGSDRLTEFAGEGRDHVMSSVSFTLGANLEDLTIIGSNGSSATGNQLDNVITGNGSSNLLAGLGGADTLMGGLGFDRATYAASNAGVNVSLATGLGFGGHAEGDTLSSIEGLIGSNFNDILEGDGGKNTLVGGAGIDTLSYRNATAGITVSLSITSAQLTGAGSDTISGFENVTGSNFADKLTGTSGANVLTGLDGNDKLYGGGGNDVLIGGVGDDYLNGGSGADAFVFDFPSEGLDTIADFLSGTDYLRISANGFGGGLSAGSSVTLIKVADLASAAGGEGGYFIFDNSGDNVGTIYWDETGGTSDDAVAFARLSNGGSLLPSDFHVV